MQQEMNKDSTSITSGTLPSSMPLFSKRYTLQCKKNNTSAGASNHITCSSVTEPSSSFSKRTSSLK